MTSTPPRVFDCDMHVLEPVDLWQHYLEPEFKDRGPVGFSEHPLDFRISIFGHVLAAGSRPDADEWRRERLELLGEQIARGFDAVSQLMAMDVEGVDRTVLFPSRGLMAMGIDYDDTRLAAAIASAYNNWLAEFCRQDPARLMGAAVLSPHDPNEAVIEARRAKEKLGFRAIHLRPNPVRGRNWYDPAYTPLWAECEALDLPVGFHEGGRRPATPSGRGKVRRQAAPSMDHRPCREPSGRDDVRDGVPDLRRRSRQLSKTARRISRSKLCLGPVFPVASGRAPGS